MNNSKPELTVEQRAYSRKVTLVGSVICLGVSIACYVTGVAPALASLAERKALEQNLTDQNRRVAELSSDLLTTRRGLQGARKQLAELPLRLEAATAVNRRINLLAGVAAESKVTLDEIQPQAPVDGPHDQTVPIRVAGSGSYPACAVFLHAMRERFPDTTVLSFDTQNGSPVRDANIATFRMELAWHTSPASK